MKAGITLISIAITLLLNSNTAKAQYVSPYEWKDGNFRINPSTPKVNTQPNNNRNNNYRPSATPSANPKQKNDLPGYTRSEYNERKRIKDSVDRAAYNKRLRNSDYYLADNLIDSLMKVMDYAMVDSVTLAFILPFSYEYFGVSWDYYKRRLVNRIISQICLNRVDSAWQTFVRLGSFDKFSEYKKTVSENGPTDLQVIKPYLLYEGGAYDTALYYCRSFIQSLRPDQTFKYMQQYMYCLQSRCLLALGKTQEAKISLDEYMRKADVPDEQHPQFSSHRFLYQEDTGFPDPYISETYGLIHQKSGNRDSALYYYRGAVKRRKEPGPPRDYYYYHIPDFRPIWSFIPPVRIAFLQAALLGGYKLDDPNDEGCKLLDIADLLGLQEANYIFANKIAWKPPVKPAIKPVPKPKKTIAGASTKKN